ncbi:hypothetical protein ACOKM3_06830 [Streptomyces sp. BH106]|uniref:hypothetical protein n=1 Tax=Streptomyces sp. BH106 TaxID=3410409 RepID=UPI003CE74758
MRNHRKFMSALMAVVGTALGTTMLTAAPASATQIAHYCEGDAVVRCANIEMPSTGVFNAHGRVTDTANGTDYDVQVTEVRLEYYVDGGWHLLKQEVPGNYWEYDQDVARTTTYSCGSSARKLIRAKVYVRWLSSTITGDWVTTPSTYICPR